MFDVGVCILFQRSAVEAAWMLRMEPESREQKEIRVLKTTGLILAGIGVALLALVGALAVLTAQLPPVSRGSVAGVILLVGGVAQLGRWQIARRRANGIDAR